jgi:hypothetical protein
MIFLRNVLIICLIIALRDFKNTYVKNILRIN